MPGFPHRTVFSIVLPSYHLVIIGVHLKSGSHFITESPDGRVYVLSLGLVHLRTCVLCNYRLTSLEDFLREVVIHKLIIPFIPLSIPRAPLPCSKSLPINKLRLILAARGPLTLSLYGGGRRVVRVIRETYVLQAGLGIIGQLKLILESFFQI